MNASTWIINARVLTLAGTRRRRGAALGELGVLTRGHVRIEGGLVRDVLEGARAPRPQAADQVMDADGRVLMPGFVDCHTHACWAGSRTEEWLELRAGVKYLDILARGGGIMSTVRAVREAAPASLTSDLRARLRQMRRCGTTTCEVKSGYGLSAEHELKMLACIRDLGEAGDGELPALAMTALLGHAMEPGDAGFAARTTNETLDRVHEAFPGITLDAYCERGAWSLEDCERLFERGRVLGHPFRVHADQFNAIGMTPWACAHGARSVDHLEACDDAGRAALGASETFGVMLPCAGFHTDGRYAPGRALVEAGALLALATNCNPGSAPCLNMGMAMALACRGCGVTPAEAIVMGTLHGAEVLGLADRGQIVPGQRADIVLLSTRDERDLGYAFGHSMVEQVWGGGQWASGQTGKGPN